MVFEVTITFDGCESALTFDLTPTYEELRSAVKADFVSTERFQMTGTTTRGSIVHVKDQASLTRVIGARHECHIEVTEQLSVARSASPARRRQAATPGGDPLPAKPRTNIKLQANCDGAIDGLKSEIRVACSTGPTVWMAEKDAGALVIRDVSDSATLHSMKYESIAGSAATACHCLLYMKRRGGAETVWAGFSSKDIKVMDARTYAPIATLREHSGAVMALAQAPGSVFSASTDFTILQWNPDSYTLMKLFSGHKNAVRCLSSVKQKLASGGDDGALILWNASTSEPLFHMQQAHAGGIHAVTIAAGAIWSAGEDGYVKVWDTETFELLAHHKEHNGDITQLLRLERKIISVGTDRKLVMYDTKQHSVVGTITHPHAAGPLSLFSVENKQLFRLWCAAGDKTMSLWRVEDQLPEGFNNAGRGGLNDGEDRTASPSRRSSSVPMPPPPPPVAAPSSADMAQLAIVKMQVEERTGRSFIHNEEARFFAEFLLLETQSTNNMQSSTMAAESYATITLDLYTNGWESCLASHATAIAVGGGLLQEMAHLSQHNQSVNERLIKGYQTEQEGAEKNVVQLRGQVTALHEELRELHNQYDILLSAHDKRKLELETAHNTRTNSEDSLRRYQEENKALQQRNAQLQVSLDEVTETANADRKIAEEHAHKTQQECDEKIFEMQQRLHELEGRTEQAERVERNATTDAKEVKENADAIVRRAEAKLAAAQEEEQRMAEKLEKDREMWKEQLKAADESYDKMKNGLTAKLNEHIAQLEQLQVDTRDAQHAKRTLEDQLALVERRAALSKEELEDENKRLKAQLADAREGWKTEVELLEKTLSERSSTQQTTDQHVREKDSKLAELQTNNMALQRRLDALNEELEKAKSNNALTATASDQRIANLESFLADAKAELAKQEDLLKAERLSRAEAEHQLQAAEENYEAVRRRHSDELQTLHEEATRERMALLQKNRSIEEGTAATIRELSTQVQARQTQVESLETINKSLEKEHEALKEDCQLTYQKCNTLEQELKDATKQYDDDTAELKRLHDSTAAELEAIQQRYLRDGQRDGEALATKTEEYEVAMATQRKLETELANVISAAEGNARKMEDLNAEVSRLKERLESERSMADNKFSEATKQADDLRSEMTTTQNALQAKTVEAEAMLHNIEELEQMLRHLRDDGDRADARLVAQVADKDEQMKKYLTEKNDAERTTQELRAFVAAQNEEHAAAVSQVQREVLRLQGENRSLSEDLAASKQRNDASSHRVAQLLEDKTNELIAVKKAAEKDVQAAESKAAQMRDDTEIARSEVTEAKRKLELQEESARQQQKALVDKHSQLQLRIDDLQAQLVAKADEMITTQRRHSEELHQEQEAAARRLDAARDTGNRGKQELLDEIDVTKKANQRQANELQEAAAKLRDVEETLKQTSRKHAAEMTEKNVALQKVSMENETLAKLERQAKEELEATSTRSRQDLERESTLLLQKNAELDNVLLEKRKLETQSMSTQLDLDHCKRRLQDYEKDIERLQERADNEYKAREEQLKKHMKEVEEMQQEALDVRQAVLEKTAMIKELERQVLVAREDTARAEKRSDELEQQHRATLAEHEGRLEEVTGQLKDLQGTGRSVRQDLEDDLRSMKGKLDATERELATTKDNVDACELRCQVAEEKLRDGRDDMAEERAALHGEIKDNKTKIMALEHEISILNGELRDAINESDKTFAALEAAREELSASTATLEMVRREAETKEGLLRRELHDAKVAATATSEEVVMMERRKTAQHINAFGEWMESFVFHATAAMSLKDDLVLDMARDASFAVVQEFGNELDALNQARDEVRRQTHELLAAKQDADRARSVSQSHNDLLGEVRLEMNNLHAKLQQEAKEHDATRVELMTLRSRMSSEARDQDVANLSEVNYLQTVIATLEAEKKALQHRADLANADFNAQFPRGRSYAASLPSPSPAPQRADSVSAASMTGSPATTFILQTRHEMVSHIAELVQGIQEARKLTYLLGQRPPVVPDTTTLVCVHDWLDSARTRGDIILRTLLTEEEQALLRR